MPYALPRGDQPRRHPLPEPERPPEHSRVYARRVRAPVIGPVALSHPLDLFALDAVPDEQLPSGLSVVDVAEYVPTFVRSSTYQPTPILEPTA